jgi:hypothetical protein
MMEEMSEILNVFKEDDVSGIEHKDASALMYPTEDSIQYYPTKTT